MNVPVVKGSGVDRLSVKASEMEGPGVKRPELKEFELRVGPRCEGSLDTLKRKKLLVDGGIPIWWPSKWGGSPRERGRIV